MALHLQHADELPLINDEVACALLGCQRVDLIKMIRAGRLRRHPRYLIFARKDVEELAREILQEIMDTNGTKMGLSKQTLGVLDGQWEDPPLV